MPHVRTMSQQPMKKQTNTENACMTPRSGLVSATTFKHLCGKTQQVLRERKWLVQFQTRKTYPLSVCGLEVHVERRYHAFALHLVL